MDRALVVAVGKSKDHTDTPGHGRSVAIVDWRKIQERGVLAMSHFARFTTVQSREMSVWKSRARVGQGGNLPDHVPALGRVLLMGRAFVQERD